MTTTTQPRYEAYEVREADRIGNKWVFTDLRVWRVRETGTLTSREDAGWIPGPSIPYDLWREYKRADRKFRSAEKKWCAADEKVTRAYKASRYIVVNHLYDEAVDGAKHDTWMKRLRKWDAEAAPLWRDYNGALNERERLLTEIAEYDAR